MYSSQSIMMYFTGNFRVLASKYAGMTIELRGFNYGDYFRELSEKQHRFQRFYRPHL